MVVEVARREGLKLRWWLTELVDEGPTHDVGVEAGVRLDEVHLGGSRVGRLLGLACMWHVGISQNTTCVLISRPIRLFSYG